MKPASLSICTLLAVLAGCATSMPVAPGDGTDAGRTGMDGPITGDLGPSWVDAGRLDSAGGDGGGGDGASVDGTGVDGATDAGADAGTGAADTGTGTGTDSGAACGAGPRARVTGRVFAPNRLDPIPNVRVVLVPDGTTFPPAAGAVVCDHCTAAPPGSIAVALSGVNGSFTLASNALDAGGTYTFVMVSGLFRHVVRHVTVGRCGALALTPAQTSFSGATAGEDTVPTIAVAGLRGTAARGTNVNDNFAAVLDAMGITGYDLYDPDRAYPAASTATMGPYLHDLLAGTSPTPLRHYEILVLPCGSLGNFAAGTNFTDAMAANLRAWLQAGGRLYASDLAYPFIDHTFPGGVTFAPGPSPHAGAAPADVGVGQGTGAGSLPTPLLATVDNLPLRAWLNGIGATTGSAIPLTELRDPWGAVDAIPPAELMVDRLGTIPGTVWVSGDVQWHTAMGTSHHPLTVQVDYPGADMNYCGRVVFTSYHVRTATTSGMPATALSPQERVLEYLFFQLTTCISCDATSPLCPH